MTRRMFSPFRHVTRTIATASSLSLISRPSSCVTKRSGVCNHFWPRQTRAYAAIPPTGLAPTHSIYVSNSTNPYFNLTLEDWLFRYHPPQAPLLLLYRDSSCVVIGRNQNPWKEVNLTEAKVRGVPWIRRRSGGGTVYHDLGNTNYSIHVPRTTFDRSATAQVVVRAVRALAWTRSAYKIVSNRAYHHGTMLISTRLDTLGDLLHTNKPTMNTKGVASVRSPVRNLVQSSMTATHQAFVDAMVGSFREEYGIDKEPCVVDEAPEYVQDEYFRVGMTELRSWDWAYGQTPEFEYVVSKVFEWGEVTSTIHSKHGLILSCSFSLSEDASISQTTRSALDTLSQNLIGTRYGFVDGSETLGAIGGGNEVGRVEEVWSWLKGEMNV
ncbi:Lipoyltransferase and lipoate-protein ligase [Melanogaster broomeanus]|nr:Lipoyltransferase and lipoate-protein ligase [Melanogaster broomeanus]